MTKPKLEPCPFCGGSPKTTAYPTLYIIECEECKIHMHGEGQYSRCPTGVKYQDFHPERLYETDLIDIWNKRVPATHPPELSGNTGELKQTKETQSDELVNLHLGIIGDEVCRWYDKGLLSQSKCCELLEITRSEFLKQLHERGIAAIQTTIEELSNEVGYQEGDDGDLFKNALCPNCNHQLYGNAEDVIFCINCFQNHRDRLESQLEDYRKAMEWLFKNYDPEDFLEERNGDYRLLHGIKNYFAATPLSAIQSAMAKEESRNE